jgi:hypothetical protein
MQLISLHTFERNKTIEKIAAGEYDNLRTYQHGQLAAQTPAWAVPAKSSAGLPWRWRRAGWAARTNTSIGDYLHPAAPLPLLNGFSAVCLYFGQRLTDRLRASNAAVPPIGLMDVSWGGSMIEQWSTNATTEGCANTSMDQAAAGTLYNGMVAPLANMSVTGWLWCAQRAPSPHHARLGNQGRISRQVSRRKQHRARDVEPLVRRQERLCIDRRPNTGPALARRLARSTPRPVRVVPPQTRASCPRCSRCGGPRGGFPTRRWASWTFTRAAPRGTAETARWATFASRRRRATACCPTRRCHAPSSRTRTTWRAPLPRHAANLRWPSARKRRARAVRLQGDPWAKNCFYDGCCTNWCYAML